MKGENDPRGMLDHTHSPEAKAKISEANKGKLLNIPRTKEAKAKMSKVLGVTI